MSSEPSNGDFIIPVSDTDGVRTAAEVGMANATDMREPFLGRSGQDNSSTRSGRFFLFMSNLWAYVVRLFVVRARDEPVAAEDVADGPVFENPESKLEELEEDRDKILKREKEIEERCEAIVSFFSGNLSTNVAIFGVGAVGIGGFIPPEIQSLCFFLGPLVLSFSLGSLVKAVICLGKLNVMNWSFKKLDIDKAKLKNQAIDFAHRLKNAKKDQSFMTEAKGMIDTASFLATTIGTRKIKRCHEIYLGVSIVCSIVSAGATTYLIILHFIDNAKKKPSCGCYPT